MVLFHFEYYGNAEDCQVFDTDGAVCKYQSQNNVHKPQTHMTSRADLKRLVKKGFIARTLVNTFGGTVHRQKGYTGDTDFVIKYEPGSEMPSGRHMEMVLTHEFEGNLGCSTQVVDNHGWGMVLIIINIYPSDNPRLPTLRLVISQCYPIRIAGSAIIQTKSMRISVRLLK